MRDMKTSSRNAQATPCISVLLPTLDNRPRLGTAIDSVLDQGRDEIELVIADDGSTGDTRAAIATRSDDPRVLVAENVGPKKTITENWRTALDASTGDYILLLGDDDALLPGSLGRLQALVDELHAPDCLSFPCYRFAAEGSVAGVRESRYEEIGLEGDTLAADGELPLWVRRKMVRDFFAFRQPFPLGVMTMVLVSRSALGALPNGLFRPPFPDFYAVAALLLTAVRWIHAPEPVLVVGISENSVAGHFHRGEREEALAYLGEANEFPGALPGNPFVNATCRFLLELKRDFPDDLRETEIDRSQYLLRSAWAWYREYTLGAIDRRELLSRFRLLSAVDLLRLSLAALRPRNLRYAATAFAKRRVLEREMLLSSTRPTDARTMTEFVDEVRPR